MTFPKARVVAVARSAAHSFSKVTVASVQLLTGEGVAGDAHRGVTVKHRSRVRIDPSQPNLRQVHLVHLELLEALRSQGFDVEPGSIGENITTSDIDLLELPRGTRLRLGRTAEIEVTGLRNPCKQLDDFQPGLMNAVLERKPDGTLIRKAGIMAVVTADGLVAPDDPILVTLPEQPHEPLERV